MTMRDDYENWAATTSSYWSCWQAAYRAGQEAIKESVSDMVLDRRGHFASDSAASAFAELVRALPVED